jgi:hypothetical protein
MLGHPGQLLTGLRATVHHETAWNRDCQEADPTCDRQGADSRRSPEHCIAEGRQREREELASTRKTGDWLRGTPSRATRHPPSDNRQTHERVISEGN